MGCATLKLPGGTTAIVCGRGRSTPWPCVKCGSIATKACDWKLDSYHTCDAHLCDACTSSPAAGKDLCPKHAKVWKTHPENPQRVLPLEGGEEAGTAVTRPKRGGVGS